jgi:hypothetical protein
MKNTIKVLGIAALVAVIGFMAACGDGDDDGNGGTNNGGNGNGDITVELKTLDITINRADSGAGKFVFKVGAVTGATGYKAYKEGAEVGSAAGTTVEVPAGALSRQTWTDLTAKALKGGEDASLTTALPGMVKYPAETPTLSGYTDWFKFLDASLTGLSVANPTAKAPHTSLHNSIKNILPILASSAAAEEDAEWAKDTYETSANAATAAVMDNWTAVYAKLAADAPTVPVAAQYLEDINDTIVPIWFNQVTGTANDAKLGNIITPEIKTKYPAVKNIE